CVQTLIVYDMTHANLVILLFFSSRRLHTRSKRDWSSDVCSSDLGDHVVVLLEKVRIVDEERSTLTHLTTHSVPLLLCNLSYERRSEERRVGKECRNVRSSRY